MHIYVGNLSLETTEDELREEFAVFGEVKSVSVMNDRYIGSGQPRGYGYVEMVSKSAGASAIANLKGKKLRDMVMSVVEALPLSPRSTLPVHDIKDIYRSSRKRERKYQMI
jgi:RNA recognition motif-containing protein